MSGERLVMRGRRGTLVVTADRRFTDEEFYGLHEAWQRAMRRSGPGLFMLEDMHVEAYILPARPRRRQGLRPRWAR